jgi:hypothetical protein
MLDHHQRGATTIINQSIDAITLANSIVGVTTEPDIQNQVFQPNRWLRVDNIAEIQEFNLSKVVVPDIALFNTMKALAEMELGLSDPAFGRETRMGGHPSPATNFLGSIEQGGILGTYVMKQIQRQIGRVGNDILTMYQFFEKDPEGKISQALGPRDADDAMKVLFPRDQSIHGNLHMDLHALSSTHNPDQERQKAIAVDQIVTNYFAKILQAVQVLSNPQVQQMPMLQAATTKAIEAYTESMRSFLDASDIDEIEKFVFELKQRPDDSELLGRIGSEVVEQLGGVQGVAEGDGMGAVLPGANGAQGLTPQPIGTGLGR